MGDDLDPFGREKDEDPLASLGWRDEESASPTEPAPHPARAAEPAPHGHAEDHLRQGEPAVTTAETWIPDRDVAAHGHDALPRGHDDRASVGSRLVRGLLMIAVVVGLGWLTLLAIANSAKDDVDRAVRSLPKSFPDFQPPPGGDPFDESEPRRAQPARGLSSGSLLRPAAFGRALSKLRSGGHGRLTNLRVAPNRIDAALVTKEARLRHVQIAAGGALRVVATTGGGFTGVRTMSLTGIVASAPSRLTRSAARRLGQRTSRVNYLILSEFAGARRWNVYFKGGQIFSADARGRITRRIS